VGRTVAGDEAVDDGVAGLDEQVELLHQLPDELAQHHRREAHAHGQVANVHPPALLGQLH
jgi:hypothetical protein